jgi:hypothetical protein
MNTVRCKLCEDVIGVYEPMAVLAEGQIRVTSRSAEGEGWTPLGECYHRDCDCYARVAGRETSR